MTDTTPQPGLNRPAARRAWILAACLIAAVVLGGCFPLLTGKAVPLWDAGDYFGPLFSLVSDHAKSGRLMLWDPWIDGGSPDFADPQVGAASPILLAFALLSPNPFHGFIAYWLVVWIFGGIGMMLLCRHLGAPLWGALVIALGFSASGVYTGNAEHTSWLYSFSYLPWILWRFDKGLVERRYWYVVQAGILWGLSALGGYPGVTISEPIFLTLWSFGRLWLGNEPLVGSGFDDDLIAPVPVRLRRSGIDLKRALPFFFVALFILGGMGVAVMSPAYFSFLCGTRGFTERAGALDRHFSLSSGLLPPAAFATLASPYLYLLKLPDHRAIWPETDISMTNIYVGVLMTVLALASLTRPSRWRLWLALLVLFFGCCAVGSHLPVRGWLYDLLPPTRYFRMPSLFRMYVIVLAGALAAYGARDLEESRQTNSRLFTASAIAAMLAVLAYAATVHGVQQSMAAAPYPLFQLVFTWIGAMAIFFLVWRGFVSRKVWVSVLIVLAVFDAGSTIFICVPTIYSADRAPYWKAMEDGHVASLDLLPHGLSRGFLPPAPVEATFNDRNVALKVADFSNRSPLKNAFFQHYLDDPGLSRIATGDQRIWFSDRPVWWPPTEAMFADFAKVSASLGTPPLLLHPPDEMKGGFDHQAQPAADWMRSAQAMAPATVELLSYRPNALSFRYHAERDGWLLVTDRWASWWTLKVNGQPEPVTGGDFIFRAVRVAHGENLVEFRYQPRGYLRLVALSWSVVALALAYQVWGFLAWRRRRPQVAGGNA